MNNKTTVQSDWRLSNNIQSNTQFIPLAEIFTNAGRDHRIEKILIGLLKYKQAAFQNLKRELNRVTFKIRLAYEKRANWYKEWSRQNSIVSLKNKIVLVNHQKATHNSGWVT